MIKKTNISASNDIVHKLKVLAKKKEGVRSRLVVTAKKKEGVRRKLVVTAKEKESVRNKLVITAKQLAVTAKERESARRKLAVTAENLALTAKEKESIKRKLVVTAKRLAKTAKEKEAVRRKLVITAKNLAATAKEKENIRKKLVITAKEKESIRGKLVVTAKQLAVTAKEKEIVRRKLAVIAKEKESVRRKLAVIAKEKESVRSRLEVIAKQLAVTAKEKESVRRKLAVIAKEKESVRSRLVVTARQLAVTAKEKESIRGRLVVTAKEKERVRNKLVVIAKQLALTAKEKESVRRKLVLTAEDLEQVRAKDEAMLASIGDGLVATDKNERILLVNKAFERILGWREKEVQGKLMSEVIPMVDEGGKEIPIVERLITRTIKEINEATKNGAERTAYENKITSGVYYVRKNKTKFPVAVTVAPVKLKNKIIGTIEVFRDITEEKEIDKAKNEFVSLASHQLRAPLTSIKWHAELLSEKIKNLGEAERTHFNELTSATVRMTDIINSFLNVTRIELGTIKIQTEKFNPIKLAEQFYTEFLPVAKNAQIQLVKEVSYTGEIFQDKTIVGNVLQNLLSNAIKYTPAGGKVTLEILQDPRESKNVLIKISDTGYGIPESEKNKIFDKMFRAKNVRQKVPDGNGLGLYIIKSLVNLIKGKIWFESRENKGTIFYVTLPKQ